jgi:hypothetical protein
MIDVCGVQGRERKKAVREEEIEFSNSMLDIVRYMMKDVGRLKEVLWKERISMTYQRRSAAVSSALAARHSSSHRDLPLL